MWVMVITVDILLVLNHGVFSGMVENHVIKCRWSSIKLERVLTVQTVFCSSRLGVKSLEPGFAYGLQSCEIHIFQIVIKQCSLNIKTGVQNNFRWKDSLEVNKSNLLLKAGLISKLDKVAQSLVQGSFENVQGWKFHSFSKWVPAIH